MSASQFELNDAEYRAYLDMLASDNEQEHRFLIHSLAGAIREELTPRQQEAVNLYYIHNRTMAETALMMGVNVSTVSRTLRRARDRLQRCLKFGAKRLLDSAASKDE